MHKSKSAIGVDIGGLTDYNLQNNIHQKNWLHLKRSREKRYGFIGTLLNFGKIKSLDELMF